MLDFSQMAFFFPDNLFQVDKSLSNTPWYVTCSLTNALNAWLEFASVSLNKNLIVKKIKFNIVV